MNLAGPGDPLRDVYQDPEPPDLLLLVGALLELLTELENMAADGDVMGERTHFRIQSVRRAVRRYRDMVLLP